MAFYDKKDCVNTKKGTFIHRYGSLSVLFLVGNSNIGKLQKKDVVVFNKYQFFIKQLANRAPVLPGKLTEQY